MAIANYNRVHNAHHNTPFERSMGDNMRVGTLGVIVQDLPTKPSASYPMAYPLKLRLVNRHPRGEKVCPSLVCNQT
jgi:hypothetical protein